MARKGGLGKGFSSLLEDNFMQVEQPRSGILQVKLTQVEPNRKQPRKTMDEEKISQLADSIQQHGIIQPLIVREIAPERYQIVAGERRWRACKLAGLEEIPVVVKEYSDRETAEIALVENLQREDLNPIEEAEGYRSLMEEYDMTQEEVAQRVGKSRPAVANSLRLMQLPDDVMDLIKWGQLSAGHGRALIPLGNRAMEGAGRVIQDGLTVRGTEKLVKKMLKPQQDLPEKEKTPEEYQLQMVEEELTQNFGRRVKIKSTGKKGGKIELDYYSEEDLNQLIDALRQLG
ncbi:MAG: ParB/RepB/Spo0J family partition protein [Eubacteriales bacterium]|jgi:ParB family chromosome partitioning protein